MKNNMKLFSIIGGSLITLGLFIAIFCFASSGFNIESFNEISDYKDVTKTYNPTGVNKINVNVSDMRIDIKKTSNNNITIKYKTSKDNYTSCDKNGESIDLLNKNSLNFLEEFKHGKFINFDFGDNNFVLIEVPDNYKGDLTIHTSNSSINLSNIKNLSTVGLETSSGEISINDVDCENAKLKSSNNKIKLTNFNVTNRIDGQTSSGSVELQSCNASEIHMKTSNSKIILDNVTTMRSLGVSTSSGRVEFKDCKASEIQMKTSNSKIILDSVTAANSLDATTSSGSITLNNVLAPSIKLKSSNGSIKGTIIGVQSEYSINADTSNGSCSPSSQSGSTDKTLNAKTSSGEIDIQFTK